MKIFIFLITFLLLSFSVRKLNAQSPPPRTFECHVPDLPEGEEPACTGNKCALNGRLHTPDGELRVLIILAEIEGTEDFDTEDWVSRPGLNYELPEFVVLDQNGKYTKTTDYIFNDFSEFNSGGPIDDQSNASISRFWNVMSKPNRDFRIVGELFTGPDGNAVPVKVPLGGSTSWYSMNKKVAAKLDEVNPDFNWSDFDLRENFPNWEFDNSNSAPDDDIDFAVILWRFESGANWGIDPHPFPSMNTWPGSGGGVASLFAGSSVTVTGVSSGSKTLRSGFKFVGPSTRVFNHEFGHVIFNASHVCGGNNVAGRYFRPTATGWGTATGLATMFDCMNGFERWYLGYIDATTIEESEPGTYTVDEFLSNENSEKIALRIPLPYPADNEGNPEQSIWIEYHNTTGAFKRHDFGGDQPGPNGVTLPLVVKPGVYIYNENIAQEQNKVNVFGSGANGIQLIDASGRWDYIVDVNEDPELNDWTNPCFTFTKDQPNPISGGTPLRDDKNAYEEPGVTIDWDGNPNSPSNKDNMGIFKEGAGVFPYRAWGFENDILSPEFKVGDKINMGTNPMILNLPYFNLESSLGFSGRRVGDYYLNGVSIEILSIDPIAEKAEIKVEFMQTEVANSVRWTGNIILPDITKNDDADLILAAGKEIVLERGKTPNQNRPDPVTGEFVGPTTLTISSNSKFHMMEDTRILVRDGSSLIIEDGADVLLENGACIVIEETGTLYLKGNKIQTLGEESVIIMRGTLKTEEDVDFTFTGPGYTSFYPTHELELGNNSDFVIVRAPTAEPLKFLELKANTTINLEDHNLELKWGNILYEGNTQIIGTQSDMVLSAVRCDCTDFGTCSAIRGNLLNELKVNGCKFYDFNYGVYSDGGNSVKINDSYFENTLTASILAKNQEGLIIEDNEFVQNHISAIDLENIFFASLRYNVISAFLDGCKSKNVAYTAIYGGTISGCNNGVRAEQSNVFLSGGLHVFGNNAGIKFENNPLANFMLSVGKCSCAYIYNNDFGVQGDNIILDIDAVEHGFECNLSSPLGNRFDNNGLIFDICYTDPGFISAEIPMKGNFWGGQSLHNYNFKLRHSGCVTPSSTVPFDDSEFLTDISQVEECGLGVTDSPMPSAPNPERPFTPQEIAEVECTIVLGQTQTSVHEQSKSAFNNFYEGNYPLAESEYQPISNLPLDTNSTHLCNHKTYIAKCMVEGIGELLDGGVQWNSDGWIDGVQTQLENGVQAKIFPNPVKNSLQIYLLKGMDKLPIRFRITDGLGRVIYSEMSDEIYWTISTSTWEKGIYFIEGISGDEKSLFTQKIVKH